MDIREEAIEHERRLVNVRIRDRRDVIHLPTCWRHCRVSRAPSWRAAHPFDRSEVL